MAAGEGFRGHYFRVFLAFMRVAGDSQRRLIGDYPEYTNRHETHNKLGFVANSFACRLLSKLHLKGIDHWPSEGFTHTPNHILFPTVHDPWYKATQIVKDKLDA